MPKFYQDCGIYLNNYDYFILERCSSDFLSDLSSEFEQFVGRFVKQLDEKLAEELAE